MSKKIIFTQKQENNIILGIVIIFLSVLIFNQFGLLSVVPSGGIIVSDDAYVDIGNPNSNYGSKDYTVVEIDKDSSDNDLHWTYLKFNIPSTKINLIKKGAILESAILYLYPTYAHRMRISLYGVDNNWDEQTLDWNNKPSLGSLITTKSILSSDEDTYISVSGFEDYISQRINQGQTEISIAITPHSSETDEVQRFDSKEEYLPNPPYLDLDIKEPDCYVDDERCVVSEFYVCENYAWVNKGNVLEKCGVECINGNTKCELNDYYTCNDYKWANNGFVIGECGTNCKDNSECEYDEKCVSHICEKLNCNEGSLPDDHVCVEVGKDYSTLIFTIIGLVIFIGFIGGLYFMSRNRKR